jgi:hypothetical protein
MNFPDTDDSLAVRTDYADDAAWDAICAAIVAPVDGFQANVAFVSDPALHGADVARVLENVPDHFDRSFLLIVDAAALQHPEHPIIVVDLREERGRVFRVIPSETWGVENNLSLGNMDFSEFADNVDADGVFRGFS